MEKNRWIGLVYVSPFIIGFLVFTVYPFIATIYFSFTSYDIMNPPRIIGLDNYKFMFFGDDLFKKSLSVTFLYVLIVVPLKLVAALGVAFILNFKLKGINLFRTVYYVPSILGGSIAVSILWKYIFAEYGLINLIVGLFGADPVPWLGQPILALFTMSLLRVWQFGSAMVIFLAALQSIPVSLYEAAEVDGAGKVRTFLAVTIPMITPVIFFNFVMQLVQAFQEFNAPYIVTQGGPLKGTYLMVLYIYESAFRHFQMGYGSALSWVLFLVIMSITLTVFRSSRYWVFYNDKK